MFFPRPRNLVVATLLLVANRVVADLPDWPEQGFVTFFPPPPPIYGAVVPATPTRVTDNGVDLAPPEDVADFVNEFFYPALATRRFLRSLPQRFAARVDAYRARRNALVAELQERWFTLQTADAAMRERELRALAEKQAPALRALEKEAEQLRHDLVHGPLLGAAVDWDQSRRWRLGDGAVGATPWKEEGEFQVVRAAAGDNDGLGVEQRGLLRELALELATTARAARGLPRRRDEAEAMFFSPATARLKLPANLEPELVTAIARFNGEKAALKQELRDKLIEIDRQPQGARASRLAALTDRQELRVEALEKLADEIRAGLAARPAAPPPTLPPIPAGLLERIEAYNQDRNALLAEYNARLLATPEPNLPDENDSRQDRMRRIRERIERMIEARRQEAVAFQTENAERIAALVRRYQAIRDDLAAIASTMKDPRSGQPLTTEALLTVYHVAMERFDTLAREDVIYAMYKVAMLQPGLSPAQRRLLFGAAHVGLAQPLPGGEMTTFPLPRPRPRS